MSNISCDGSTIQSSFMRTTEAMTLCDDIIAIDDNFSILSEEEAEEEYVIHQPKSNNNKKRKGCKYVSKKAKVMNHALLLYNNYKHDPVGLKTHLKGLYYKEMDVLCDDLRNQLSVKDTENEKEYQDIIVEKTKLKSSNPIELLTIEYLNTCMKSNDLSEIKKQQLDLQINIDHLILRLRALKCKEIIMVSSDENLQALYAIVKSIVVERIDAPIPTLNYNYDLFFDAESK
jgi:hypothetical protein